jgi:RHS repeat-associated protein
VVAVFDIRRFQRRNALGSVMEITDMNEAEVESYRYDPYGAVTITVGGTPQSSDPLGNPWTYTGRFHDEETGLYYYRARYYSPMTGRFPQRDPLGLAISPNLYEYARSCPVSFVDSTGTVGESSPRGPDARGHVSMSRDPGHYVVGGSFVFSQHGGVKDVGKLLVRQELQVWIWLWKKSDTAGPSYTEYIHIVEYFHLNANGNTGTDSHHWSIDRSKFEKEGFCAFKVYVFSTLQAGTATNPPSSDWGYTDATRSVEGGRPQDVKMKSNGGFGKSGRIDDPGFTPVTHPSYYTYSAEGNWCKDRNLLTEWPGDCGELGLPRGQPVTPAGKVIEPTPEGRPKTPPRPGPLHPKRRK